MESLDLDITYGRGISFDLKPGMAWVLYFDDGPGGPCGQDCRTTCPHAHFTVYPDEQSMRDAMENYKPRNKKARIMHGVVDEYTAGGVFRVMKHGESE